MVREHQTETAAVNIKMVAQLLAVHCRTFTLRLDAFRPHLATGFQLSVRPLFDIFPQHVSTATLTSTTFTRAPA